MRKESRLIQLLFRYDRSQDDDHSEYRRPERNSGFDRRNDRFSGRPNGYGAPNRNNYNDQQELKRINWTQETLTPLRKNFYSPSPSVAARSREEIDAFHRKHDIKVRGQDAPESILDFTEVGFPSYITTEMGRRGFKEPTVIQSQAWPIAMSGRDMVGIAQTGSGRVHDDEDVKIVKSISGIFF